MPALPFIVLGKDGKFTIDERAAEFLERIDAPLAVVACAGKYRTGKSSLLNRVLLDVQGDEGFGVGQTVQACTKGLWLHTKLLGVPRGPDGSLVNVLVVDTEGLGAFNATCSHDSRIFSLALLVSSYFIYNSVGTIDEQAISTLSLVANISKHVRAKSGNGSADETDEHSAQMSEARELGQLFPDFLWVVRDFSLQLRTESGDSLSPNGYLEQALRDKQYTDSDGGDGGQAEERRQAMLEKNHLRTLLRAYFPRRQCATMVRPCANEYDLQRVDTMSKSEMRPEFWRTARTVRATVLSDAQPKTVMNGKPLSGRGLLRLCRTYVDAMNSGVAPVIRDSWALLSEVQFRDALEAATQCFRDTVEASGDGPCDPLRMQSVVNDALQNAKRLFTKESPENSGPMHEQFSQRLSAALSQLVDDARETNLRCVTDCARALLEQHIGGKQFDTWQQFMDVGWNVAEQEFEKRVGRSPHAQSAWARLALPRMCEMAQRFGDRCDAVRDEVERYKQSALKAEQWRDELREAEEALRETEEKQVERDATAEAKYDVLRERFDEFRNKKSAEKEAESDANKVGEQEWQRREAVLRSESDALVQAAQASAKRAQLELTRIQESNQETQDEFEQRFKTLRDQTEHSLREMRVAREHETEALRAAADRDALRAQEAEQCAEQGEKQLQVLKRKHQQTVESAEQMKLRSAEERDRNADGLKKLHEQWRADTKRQHDEKLELTRAAKVAEAKLALQQQELSAMRASLQEERPNVEAERAMEALERVEQQSKQLRSELFEARQSLEEQRTEVQRLERALRDQKKEHEMARYKLKMDYELEGARNRAQQAIGRGANANAMGSGVSGVQLSKRAKNY